MIRVGSLNFGVGDYIKVLRDGQRMWWRVIQIGDHVKVQLESTPFPDAPLPPSWQRGDVEMLSDDDFIFDAITAQDWPQ